MLLNIILTALGGLIVLVVICFLKALRQLSINIKKAQSTGLQYVVAPFMAVGSWQLLISEFLTPWLLYFPIARDWEWVHLQKRNLSWFNLRAPESKYGDTWMVVTPFTCSLKTSNAELISQVLSRTKDFHKPIQSYKILNLFGENILSSEGETWRRHKKIVGIGFGEKSNRYVFEESVKQGRGMLEEWMNESKIGAQEDETKEFVVKNAAEGTATLSLHVICAAGFGVPQLWPHEGEEKLNGMGIPGFSGHTLIKDHQMSMKAGLIQLLHLILWVFILPHWMLKISPFKAPRAAFEAFIECKAYFKELIEAKTKMAQDDHGIAETSEEKRGIDLLGAMMKASAVPPPSQARIADNGKESFTLSENEIIGNSFIFLLAGHETTANSIYFSMIYLACNPGAQRAMQGDIDRILDGRDVSELEYHKDMPRLYNSLVGAVFNEEVRLIPATPDVPRIVFVDQTVHMDGADLVIPSGTYLHVNVVGVNRNPRYWGGGKIGDLDEFVPARWLRSLGEDEGEKGDEKETSFDGFQPGIGEHIKSLWKPEKGVFMSFSEGARVCPGKRFAQVETTAVLASIFSTWSVELDASEWASDDELERMDGAEKKDIYARAVRSAHEKIRRSDQVITLQMTGEDKVPLRFIKRGMERISGREI